MTVFYYEWPRAFAGKTKGEVHPVMRLHWERGTQWPCSQHVFLFEKAKIVKTAILSSAGWGGPAWLPVTMVKRTFSPDGLFIATILGIILSVYSFSPKNVMAQGTACAWTFFPKHQWYGKDYSTESFRDNFFKKQIAFWLAESSEVGSRQVHSCSCRGCRVFCSVFKDREAICSASP